MSAEFKVGDKAWVARFNPEQVTVTCPVCAGKREVTIVLGDDSRVVTPCNYCERGYDGPRGVVTEYQRNPRARLCEVLEVRTEETAAGVDVKYLVDETGVLEADEMFRDEAPALALALRKAAEMDASDERQRRTKKDGTLKKLSWSVGYHLRETREHKRLALYHEERAMVCREEAKAEKATP